MRKLSKLSITAGLALVLMTASFAFAEKEEILDALLAGAEAATPLNWKSEKLVWKTGNIDFVSADGVVLDDVAYSWSRFGTRFRDIDGSIIGLENFSPGLEATFVLAADRNSITTLIRGNVRTIMESRER